MKTAKKTFSAVTILIFIFVTGTSFGQNQKFGFKAGVTLSDIKSVMTLPEINPGSIDPYSGKSKVTGFCIFASYDVIKNKFLTLSGEAGYVRKGFKYNTETQNGNGEITGKGSIKNSFSYIDLSANVKFILRKKTVSPYISVTPVLGIYLGNSTTVTGDKDSISMNNDVIVFDNLNTISFGTKIGAGAEIYGLIKNIPVVLECRYNPDLIDVYNKQNETNRNRTIEFNIGIKF